MRLRTCRKIVVRSFVEFCSANLKFCRAKSCAIFCTFCLLEVRAMHRYLYRVYCLTPAASLCSDNTQMHHLLFTGSKGHGSGCTTAISGVHRYLYRVYCLTLPTALCSDNTQNLHSSMVVWIPKCPHPSPKINVLATHPSL